MSVIIFLNGEVPGKKVINKYLKNSELIVAADGGGNYLRSGNILPDIILGDMDSIKAGNLKYFIKKSVKIIKISEQETTDFEKCLIYCKKNKFREVIVFGALSMRPDHTLNNFSILKRYSKIFLIKIVSDEFEIFFIDKKIKINYRKNETITIQGIPKAKGIKTKGLKYELNNEELEFGIREGSLNESDSDQITINYKSGNLLLFKKHFIK